MARRGVIVATGALLLVTKPEFATFIRSLSIEALGGLSIGVFALNSEGLLLRIFKGEFGVIITFDLDYVISLF